MSPGIMIMEGVAGDRLVTRPRLIDSRGTTLHTTWYEVVDAYALADDSTTVHQQRVLTRGTKVYIRRVHSELAELVYTGIHQH